MNTIIVADFLYFKADAVYWPKVSNVLSYTPVSFPSSLMKSDWLSRLPGPLPISNNMRVTGKKNHGIGTFELKTTYHVMYDYKYNIDYLHSNFAKIPTP